MAFLAEPVMAADCFLPQKFSTILSDFILEKGLTHSNIFLIFNVFYNHKCSFEFHIFHKFFTETLPLHVSQHIFQQPHTSAHAPFPSL